MWFHCGTFSKSQAKPSSERDGETTPLIGDVADSARRYAKMTSMSASSCRHAPFMLHAENKLDVGKHGSVVEYDTQSLGTFEVLLLSRASNRHDSICCLDKKDTSCNNVLVCSLVNQNGGLSRLCRLWRGVLLSMRPLMAHKQSVGVH
eukprot:5140126-Amphidinium_carterae.3